MTKQNVSIEREKESASIEYSVYVDGTCVGAYFFGEGLVLNGSEGSPISLDALDDIMRQLHTLEANWAE